MKKISDFFGLVESLSFPELIDFERSLLIFLS